jgi:energy-coupling factor transporter transmembrane protein EcfT
MTFGFASLQVPDSLLSRLDPRWKLAGLSVAGVMVLFLRTVPAASTALALSLCLVPLGRLGWSRYLRRAGPVILLVGLFVAWLPFVTEGPSVEVGPVSLSEKGLLQGSLILAKALTGWFSGPRRPSNRR